MTTERKAATNRANAKRSTGPRTSSGKAVTRLNAIGHGLRALSPVLPGERPKDWADHRAGIVTGLAPLGTLECELAERVALLTWRLRRVVAYEVAATAAGLDAAVAHARGENEEPDPFAGLLSFRTPPRTYAVVRKELDATRENVETFARTAVLFAWLQAAAPDERLDGEDAVHLIHEATGYTPHGDEEVTDVFDRDFLGQLGVPEEWRDEPEEWDGWTAKAVMAGVKAVAEDDGTTAPALVARAIREAGRSAEAERLRVVRVEAELVPLAERAAAAERAGRGLAVLPDSVAVEKVMRYETHLGKQLVQTLHLLERLQAVRSGNPPVPPVAVDVTVDGPLALNPAV
jgi:hypothetical protein